MKNVNLNRQFVNIKIGCEKGKRKHGPMQGCLKVKHHHERRHLCPPRWQEHICLDFRVSPNEEPQTIWRAVDLEPMGTLNVENRSVAPIELIVTKQHGQEIIEEVQAKSAISMTLKELEKVEVACQSEPPTTFCYGRLRLHLIIPYTKEHHCR